MTPRHRKARQLDLLSQADGGFCLVGERTQDGARLLQEDEEAQTRARKFEEAQRDLFPQDNNTPKGEAHERNSHSRERQPGNPDPVAGPETEQDREDIARGQHGRVPEDDSRG